MYPIFMYRACDWRVNANQNTSVIEGLMSTMIITTIKIHIGVLDQANRTLCEVYKQIGKLLLSLTRSLKRTGEARTAHTQTHHGIELVKLVF